MRKPRLHSGNYNSSIFLAILAVILVAGCRAAPLDELAEEFDIQAEVLAIVAPDTVQVGELFEVEVGFPLVCGGRFSRVDEYVASYGIVLTPVLRVKPQPGCPGSYPAMTISKMVSFPASGRYDVVASGRFGEIHKSVTAISTVQPGDSFAVAFRFIGSLNTPQPYQGTKFWFPDRLPLVFEPIYSDSVGVWRYSFNDTLESVRYGINGMIFTAKRGVKESGILLFQ